MKSYLLLFTIGSLARDTCDEADQDRLEGGKGLFERIISCSTENNIEKTEACITPKFNELDLTEDCSRCIAEFLIQSENAGATSNCAQICHEQSPQECNNCITNLGTKLETQCSSRIGEIHVI
jgi:hypothetical protein